MVPSLRPTFRLYMPSLILLLPCVALDSRSNAVESEAFADSGLNSEASGSKVQLTACSASVFRVAGSLTIKCNGKEVDGQGVVDEIVAIAARELGTLAQEAQRFAKEAQPSPLTLTVHLTKTLVDVPDVAVLLQKIRDKAFAQVSKIKLLLGHVLVERMAERMASEVKAFANAGFKVEPLKNGIQLTSSIHATTAEEAHPQRVATGEEDKQSERVPPEGHIKQEEQVVTQQEEEVHQRGRGVLDSTVQRHAQSRYDVGDCEDDKLVETEELKQSDVGHSKCSDAKDASCDIKAMGHWLRITCKGDQVDDNSVAENIVGVAADKLADLWEKQERRSLRSPATISKRALTLTVSLEDPVVSRLGVTALLVRLCSAVRGGGAFAKLGKFTLSLGRDLLVAWGTSSEDASGHNISRKALKDLASKNTEVETMISLGFGFDMDKYATALEFTKNMA